MSGVALLIGAVLALACIAVELMPSVHTSTVLHKLVLASSFLAAIALLNWGMQ